MTYFHRRTSTIIGAKAFHDSVRDGKAWVHLAMIVKRNGLCHGGPGSAAYGAPPARQGQSGRKQVKCLCVCVDVKPARDCVVGMKLALFSINGVLRTRHTVEQWGVYVSL